MLTFFTTAKPFLGHSGIIQRNALQSWKLLNPDVEVILFGNEEGVAEVCAELGLLHEPHVEHHESGLKYVNFMFARAQQIARHDCLCYSNCDIIFCQDFYQAVRTTFQWKKQFLLIGQRWDTDIAEKIDFTKDDWDQLLRKLARTKGFKQIPDFVDYFAFPRGLYDEVPPMVVGRSYWDWWLVGKAISVGVPVVDCTPYVLAIHQNHGYAYHPKGKKGTHSDSLARYNVAVGGGRKHLRFTIDSSHKIDQYGVIHPTPLRRRTRLCYLVVQKIREIYGDTERFLKYDVWLPAWHFCLNLTRPLRTRLGLRSKASRQA